MARAVHKFDDARCHYAGGTTSELGTPSAPADSEGKDGALHIIEGAGRDKGLGGASSTVECFCVVNLKQVSQPGQQHRDPPGMRPCSAAIALHQCRTRPPGAEHPTPSVCCDQCVHTPVISLYY